MTVAYRSFLRPLDARIICWHITGLGVSITFEVAARASQIKRQVRLFS